MLMRLHLPHTCVEDDLRCSPPYRDWSILYDTIVQKRAVLLMWDECDMWIRCDYDEQDHRKALVTIAKMHDLGFRIYIDA